MYPRQRSSCACTGLPETLTRASISTTALASLIAPVVSRPQAVLFEDGRGQREIAPLAETPAARCLPSPDALRRCGEAALWPPGHLWRDNASREFLGKPLCAPLVHQHGIGEGQRPPHEFEIQPRHPDFDAVFHRSPVVVGQAEA